MVYNERILKILGGNFMLNNIIVYGFMVFVVLVFTALAVVPQEAPDYTKQKAIWYEVKVAVKYFKYRLKIRGLL